MIIFGLKYMEEINMEEIVSIENAVPRLKDVAFKHPVSWKIKNGEHWVVIGPNGSGKTLLIDILIGKYALKSGEIICKNDTKEKLRVSDVVKSVAFRDIYSLADIQNSYYQQRWNAGDEHEVPLIQDLLKSTDDEWVEFLISNFRIQDLIEKPVNLLSSGELRKFLIVRTLLKKPRVLILDNPYIGLDAASRIVLNDMFNLLARIDHIQVVLVLSNPNDIPEIITHVLPVNNKALGKSLSRSDFFDNSAIFCSLFPPSSEIRMPNNREAEDKALIFDNAILFKNIKIAYGTHKILNNLDWQVKRGEKWALLGENGAGKSTLLSLVAADNPQAYANDITLFDRKRGSGESIWDIKKRIGYISPEMHLYYLKNVKCLDIVGSGFFDTIGLYRKCDIDQEKIALQWMAVFGIEQLKDQSFLNISSGEQRLVLLARVFVKSPDLLILDEPLHGLDVANKQRVKSVIEQYCDESKTLIYVTHYENEIPSVVDKRLVLSKYKEK